MTRKDRAITNLKQMCSDGRYLGSGSYAPLEVLEDFNLAIKALEQEQTTKIEESNFSQEQYKADLQSAYDCGLKRLLSQDDYCLVSVASVKRALKQEPTTKNNLAVDCIDRQATLDAIIKRLGIKNEKYLLEAERDIYQQILAMPSVTPQLSSGLEKNSKKLEKYFGESDCISRQAVLDLIADYDLSMGQVVRGIHALPSVKPQEPRWIPVNERVAEFPCLACDIFDQIFIPSGIVVLNSRCYEGKDFDFNVEKFLRGKEVIMCGGKKAYLRPREIAAWMPLPKPYEPMESEG